MIATFLLLKCPHIIFRLWKSWVWLGRLFKTETFKTKESLKER